MPELNLSTRDKFAVAQILQTALDKSAITVDLVTAINGFDRPLTPTAEGYLRGLDGCEIKQAADLFKVILGQLEQAFYGEIAK
jgi:hypothetical protein